MAPRNSVVIAGDGRYHNDAAIQTIAQLLAANGIRNIWIPRNGIMSTPAVSAVIRRRTPDGGGSDGDGVAQGGIVLTASHNPGGPGEDFGIKYNEGLGQPAGEEFTEAVSLALRRFDFVNHNHKLFSTSQLNFFFRSFSFHYSSTRKR